jgi:hypothetical protein
MSTIDSENIRRSPSGRRNASITFEEEANAMGGSELQNSFLDKRLVQVAVRSTPRGPSPNMSVVRIAQGLLPDVLAQHA